MPKEYLTLKVFQLVGYQINSRYNYCLCTSNSLHPTVQQLMRWELYERNFERRFILYRCFRSLSPTASLSSHSFCRVIISRTTPLVRTNSFLSSGHAVPLAGYQGSLAFPPFVPLLPQPDPPAEIAGAQQAQTNRQQHQSQHRDGGSVGVKGVGHRRDHDAGDEDDHAEWDRAAVAGHLGTASGCC